MTMLRLILIAVCAIAAVSCAPKKQQATSSDAQESESAYYESLALDDSIQGNYGGKSGYSSGSGLRTIAQGSAEQANNAVVNQHTAARQAVFTAKSNLAQAAAGASATAQAALVGKQILIQKLEADLEDAEQALEAEIRQFHLAQRAATASQEAARQAQQQINAFNNALNNAQNVATYAAQAAEATAAEVGSQSGMVGAAKQRLATLSEQLHAAEVDFEATQAAAQKAQVAAQIAQSNAAQAAESAQSNYESLNKYSYHH